MRSSLERIHDDHGADRHDSEQFNDHSAIPLSCATLRVTRRPAGRDACASTRREWPDWRVQEAFRRFGVSAAAAGPGQEPAARH